MLREVTFRIRESYVLCQQDLTFFFHKEKDGKLEPLFFDIKVDSMFSYQYYGYGPTIYVTVFKLSKSYDSSSAFYLAFEYWKSSYFDDLFFQFDLPEISILVKNNLGIGSGEFKYFSTEGKLQRYYSFLDDCEEDDEDIEDTDTYDEEIYDEEYAEEDY